MVLEHFPERGSGELPLRNLVRSDIWSEYPQTTCRGVWALVAVRPDQRIWPSDWALRKSACKSLTGAPASGMMRAEGLMATSKKNAVGKKMTTRADALCPAKPLSVSTVRERLGVSRRMFSRLAGFSERAIADWESGKPVSEPGLRRIKELDRFRDRLSEVVEADAIPGWLDTPNEAFDGLKPLEVIERGEIDRLWNMIFYLESGVGS
jgi:DNA-binding transcriptional regulator YiaG